MTMKVEFWSDIVCPWCYIGKRRFEKALSQFEHREEVEVIWRSFELDPSSPRHSGDLMESLSKKMGRTIHEVKQMTEQITTLAAQDGLEYRFDLMKPGNTFDAHRLIHYSATQGIVEEVSEHLYHAYFTEGLPVGDVDSLITVAEKAGLDGTKVRNVLESDLYSDEVRADERYASALKITGVPFVLVSEKYAISGAQTVEVFLNALRQAWNEAHPITMVGDAGNSCDDGNCLI
jgi:predicted DsbA family dithiol-disulfide isomerase